MFGVVGGAGGAIADIDGADGTVASGFEFDRVKGVAGFGDGELGGLDRVVAELFLGQLVLRVAELTPGNDAVGVELDLDFDIRGRDTESASQLTGELRGGLLWRVDKSVTASTGTGKDFKEAVVVFFPADTETIEGDALGAVGLDFLLELIGVNVAEVGSAVGKEDDAVFAVGQVMAQGGFIGEAHGFFQIGAAFGVDGVEFSGEFGGLIAGNAVGHKPGGAGEDDDAKGVLRPKLGGEDAEGLVDDADAVGAFHRAGFVEEEDEIERAAGLASFGGGFDGEAEEVAVVGEGIAGAFPVKADRRAGCRFGTAIVEGVDEFLGADGGGVGQEALLEAGGGELEGDIADVEREGGEGVGA